MTLEEILTRMRRFLVLDDAAVIDVRDDVRFTLPAVGAAAFAVLLAGIGAYLYGETVLDSTPSGWFVDTVILGSLITFVLFLAGVGVIYVMLTQAFRVEMTSDAVVRVVTLAYLPYALGLFVFIGEIGFAFGVFSLLATFYYAIYGLSAAAPRAGIGAIVISVFTGFSVWLLLIPLISDFPGNNFVTGVFVYSLAA